MVIPTREMLKIDLDTVILNDVHDVGNGLRSDCSRFFGGGYRLNEALSSELWIHNQH